jgi:hypothetical protein
MTSTKGNQRLVVEIKLKMICGRYLTFTWNDNSKLQIKNIYNMNAIV